MAMVLVPMVRASCMGRALAPLQRALFIAACTMVSSTTATGSRDAHLSHGQVVGIVVGSVAGGVLLLLAACLCCCLYMSSRRRQTGDLTWAKTADLEAAVAYAPQDGGVEPSPDSGSTPNRSAGGAGSSGGGAKPVLPVAVAAGDGLTPLETAAAAAALQDNTGSARSKTPSRGRGGMVHFLLNRKALSVPRNVFGAKEKHLEVSRSARVEPSAEVEMSMPFEPATTNHGPPLSKSSMLLRWLHGAEDDHADAVAAQLVAAAAAVAASVGGATPSSAGKASSALGKRGSPVGGLSPFSDRLPLLSLAAQQTGIVWSKMPPSVASSPAVSVTDGSLSRHMLKGSWKRSDAPDDRLSPGGAQYSGASFANAQLEAGDERYPASLASTRIDMLGTRPHQRAGIVFDHLTAVTPSGSRTSTIGGSLASRPPTFGGAVLPMPPSASVVNYTNETAAAAGAPSAVSFGGALAVAAAAAAAGQGLQQQQRAQCKGIWDPVAEASGAQAKPKGQQQDSALAQDATQPSPWLHQVPPSQLTALREEDEEHAEVALKPVPRPPLLAQSSSKQLTPLAPPLMAGFEPLPPLRHSEGPSTTGASLGPAPASSSLSDAGDAAAGPSRDSSATQLTAPSAAWIRFSNDGGSRPSKAQAGALPPLPVGAAPRSPTAARSRAGSANSSFSSSSRPPTLPRARSGEQLRLGLRASAPHAPLPPAGPGASHEPAGVVRSLSSQSSGEQAAPAAPADGNVSPTAARMLATRRRGAPLPPLMRTATRSGEGSRSPAAASPSLGLHFPDLPEAWEEPPPIKSAAAEAEKERQRNLRRSGSASSTGSAGAAPLRRTGSGGAGAVRGRGSRGAGGRGRSGSDTRPESPVAGDWGAALPSPSSSVGVR